MSQSEHLESLYEEICNFFICNIEYPKGTYPKLSGVDRNHIDDLLKHCVKFYNVLDSSIIVLEKTINDVYLELKNIIDDKLFGNIPDDYEYIVDFKKPYYYNDVGSIVIPDEEDNPSGIKNTIELLKKSLFNYEVDNDVLKDEYYTTARYAFFSLRGHLSHFITRFNYVMMYPHRILLDRTILETGLKRHGFDRVIKYIQSSEEHFNNKKYVEFCAMARNALEESINNASLLMEGYDHGFSNNLTKLKEIGFLKGTIVKQIKEYRGSLSAAGSHPPKEEISSDEAKLFLDQLYGFLGFITIRLSRYKEE